MEENQENSIQLKQLQIMKKQLLYSRLGAIFTFVLVVLLAYTVITVTPKLNNVLQNLEQISSDLNNEDLREMIQNINTLAETSQSGVEDTTDKISEIDLEGLNEAIEDLRSVISPLAGLLGGGTRSNS